MSSNDYHGYRRLDFIFAGREAVLVFPKEENKTDKWMIKTEYFDAFPELEIAMLGRGYHLAYLKNHNRWGTDDDAKAKRDFAEYLAGEYGLSRRCVCIGMSCGGWEAVAFAALYPAYVSLLYLDAPLLSFYGLEQPYRTDWIGEYGRARGYTSVAERFMDTALPIYQLKTLTENRLPVALVYGAKDKTVSPEFNAEVVKAFYEKEEAPIRVWCKPECDHHPHVAVDLEEVMDYIAAESL